MYRKLLKRSPIEFALLFRIRHAQRLLVETDLELGCIAEQLGYTSLAFFSRQFKHQVGMPPSGYRERVRSAVDARAPSFDLALPTPL